MFKGRIPYFIVSVVLVLLFNGLIFKGKINKINLEQKQEKAQGTMFLSAAELVRTHYIYTKNNQKFSFSLLEFGSLREPVLEEVTNSAEDRIFIASMPATNPDNRKFY